MKPKQLFAILCVVGLLRLFVSAPDYDPASAANATLPTFVPTSTLIAATTVPTTQPTMQPTQVPTITPSGTASKILYMPYASHSGPFGIELKPIIRMNKPNDWFAPVGITNAGDERLFVVSQKGIISIVADWAQLETPFLDITEFVDDFGDGGEKGMFAIAFHPEYATNGYFYVSYTGHRHENDDFDSYSVIERYTVSADDPNVADRSSRLRILEVPQPTASHNGGDLHFGPDGYLYLALGDGTRTDYPDPLNNAQHPKKLLGKMLRIDVDKKSARPPDCYPEGAYTIPADNPFLIDNGTCDEIWSIGHRNPWRFSFDSQTGEMFIGDVGYHWVEEINYEPASHNGGNNYGWRCYEGWDARFIEEGCLFSGNQSDYTFPIATIRSTLSTANSITGGYVYRGNKYPEMEGFYFFGDFVTGDIYTLAPSNNNRNIEKTLMLQKEGFFPSTFGEGSDGSIYVANFVDDMIYRIEPVR